ncbi:hypothetical protein, partial [Paraburkholderia phenazinium]|uniref:hypothetical protein n=1 Tax=Paraburkholderia phenazinium TaxID=60549 RepID=UPI001ABAE22C
ARSSPTVAMFMMNAPLPWTSQHVHFGTNASPLSGSRPSHQSPFYVNRLQSADYTVTPIMVSAKAAVP